MLLNHMYKWPRSRLSVTINLFILKSDDFQPLEQAGFREAFSTAHHINTLPPSIQKTVENNRALFLAYVDYYKPFIQSKPGQWCITCSDST
ncbi:hypothetical protein EVAR_52814_1 [Eumeta japonica]|uniref:Uncharacterized protein n=1 Tax=Eumeta variegata TaxID=151549 RepID=A0A4C1Y543_EUMVA|nr:hypothetical protein EVAR_52814_1 [Eumeta japonica]